MKRLAMVFGCALMMSACGSGPGTDGNYTHGPNVVTIVHSEPEHEYKVPAGTSVKTFTFSIDTPGQVAVESHGLGVTILQLVVRP